MHEISGFLLGSVRVLLDGQMIALPFRQVEALLYYLMVEGKTSRYRIADIIWGERGDDKKVRSSLRNAVYVLRKSFGMDFLVETPQKELGINPQYHISTDLVNFLQADEIPDKYPGDFLQDFYLKDNELYNNWVQEVNQSYSRIYLERLREKISQSYHNQQWDICENFCLQMLSLDEYDESNYCRLIELYQKRGEYSKALNVYTRMEKLFSEELFQEPSQETINLMKRIRELRNQQTTMLLAQKMQESVSVRKEAAVFGRDEEIRTIKATIHDFSCGKGGKSVVVTGESGIGKSFLLESILRHIDKYNVSLFSTRCYQPEENYVLKPWQAIFSQLAPLFKEHLPGKSAMFTEAISNVFPFFRSSQDVTVDPDVITTLRDHTFELTISHLLIELAQKQKLVFFFDDLQWADEITISVIQDVLTTDRHNSVLFLFTYRNDRRRSCDNFMEDMLAAKLLKKIELNRFSYEKSIEFSSQLLPNGFANETMKRCFYQETAGNPFFMVETANSFLQNGSMAGITQNIRDSLASRIMRLSDECRNILNLLSVFFDGASFDILLELTKWADYELIEIIETLTSRQFIYEQAQPDGVKFFFFHQKIQEYVYGELSITKKSILHRKVALCFEQKLRNTEADIPLYSNLMYHFQHAGDKIKHLQYYVEYVYSYLNHSHEYYPLLINQVSHLNISADREQGRICADDDNVSSILNDIRRMVEDSIGDLREEDYQGFLSDYLHMMGRYHIRKVEYGPGMAYIQRLVDINKGCYNKRSITNMIRANRQIICIYIDRDEKENMRTVIQESLALVEQFDKVEEKAIWMRLSGLCYIMSGKIEEGIRDLRWAIDAFNHSSQKERYLYNLAASYAWLGEAERHRMNYDSAKGYYDKAITICKDHFLVGGTATFYTYAGQAALDSGDLPAAEEYLSQAVSQFSEIELMWGRGVAFGYYAMLCVQRGRYEESLSCFEKAIDFTRRLESCYEEEMLNRMFAQIAVRMKDDRKLRDVFGTLITLSPEAYIQRALALLKDVYSPIDRYYLEQLCNSNDFSKAASSFETEDTAPTSTLTKSSL